MLKRVLVNGTMPLIMYPSVPCSLHPAASLSQNLSERLSRRERESQQLEEHVSEGQASLRALQAKLQQRDLEAQEAQARAAQAEASLGRAQAELGESGGGSQGDGME